MQTYEILVRNRSVTSGSSDTTLVRTSVGVDQVHVLFDNDEWLEFPVSITFSNGNVSVSSSIILNLVHDVDGWVAETTADIPHEVTASTGPIRVTLQGTDSDGRHIITSAGAPLSVVEAGDVVSGDEPSDAPPASDWWSAYANAMQAVNQASSLVNGLQSQIDEIVARAESELRMAPATTSSLGVVQIGDGLDITESGVLSASQEHSSDAEPLYDLASALVDTPFIDGGANPEPTIRDSVLPIATASSVGAVYPDCATISIDESGMLYSILDSVAATIDTIGMVKPDGSTITIDQDGTIHGSSITSIATLSSTGVVKPDGTTITVDQDGTIHGADATPVATTSSAGKVKPDGTTITVDNDGTIHGAASSHPDWNENDPESDGYIANRPFYHHVENDVLLDDLHLGYKSYEAYREPSYVEYPNILLESGLVVGRTYTVTMSDSIGLYNGTSDVECTMGTSYPMLDGYISGKHFRVACDGTYSNSSVTVMLYAFKRSNPVSEFGDADISIAFILDTLVKVPSKYLPEATDTTNGMVKYDNNTIKVNSDGQMYVDVNGMSEIKVDNDTIKINSDGELYADNVEVKVDNSTIKINANGELYVALQNAANVGF